MKRSLWAAVAAASLRAAVTSANAAKRTTPSSINRLMAAFGVGRQAEYTARQVQSAIGANGFSLEPAHHFGVHPNGSGGNHAAAAKSREEDA